MHSKQKNPSSNSRRKLILPTMLSVLLLLVIVIFSAQEHHGLVKMEIIIQLVWSSLTAFGLSLLAIPICNEAAIKFGLTDKPNERKTHKGHIPLIGGVAIFIAVLISSFIWLPDSQDLRLYQIASALIVFIGILDDKYDVSVRLRVVAQLIIASILIYGVNTYIHSFGNLLGIGNIDIGILGIPFTYLAVLAAINAFNMVDGIDGLLGSLSINAFVSIAILILFSGNTTNVAYPLIVATAIVPYLFFNMASADSRFRKIFMGDAGSMFIGLSVVWMLSLTTQGESANFRPVTALWIIAIPLMDMVAIVFRRLKKGANPFKPDRDHLHHIFMRVGFSDREALKIITTISVILSSIGIIGELYSVPEPIMLFAFLTIFLGFLYTIRHILDRI